MKSETTAFLASSILHLLVAGGAVSIAGIYHKQPEPIMIDLSIAQVEPPGMRAMGGNQGVAPLPAAAAKTPPRSARTLVAATPPPGAPPMAQAATMPADAAAAPVPTTDSQAMSMTAPAAVPSGGAAGTAAQPGPGGQGTTGGTGADVTGTGGGVRGESAEALRERYLRQHFGYIRDLINNNLRYPGRARRMGWSGALKVEFVVRVDGSVEAIRIVKSSGVPLLDCNAMETVRRSAPFPKPPISARLIIPVEYLLE